MQRSQSTLPGRVPSILLMIGLMLAGQNQSDKGADSAGHPESSAHSSTSVATDQIPIYRVQGEKDTVTGFSCEGTAKFEWNEDPWLFPNAGVGRTNRVVIPTMGHGHCGYVLKPGMIYKLPFKSLTFNTLNNAHGGVGFTLYFVDGNTKQTVKKSLKARDDCDWKGNALVGKLTPKKDFSREPNAENLFLYKVVVDFLTKEDPHYHQTTSLGDLTLIFTIRPGQDVTSPPAVIDTGNYGCRALEDETPN